MGTSFWLACFPHGIKLLIGLRSSWDQASDWLCVPHGIKLLIGLRSSWVQAFDWLAFLMGSSFWLACVPHGIKLLIGWRSVYSLLMVIGQTIRTYVSTSCDNVEYSLFGLFVTVSFRFGPPWRPCFQKSKRCSCSFTALFNCITIWPTNTQITEQQMVAGFHKAIL